MTITACTYGMDVAAEVEVDVVLVEEVLDKVAQVAGRVGPDDGVEALLGSRVQRTAMDASR